MLSGSRYRLFIRSGTLIAYYARVVFSQMTHVIQVGATGSFFDPPTINAEINDTVLFYFTAFSAHSVIQSSFDHPCFPLPGGFSSGLAGRENEWQAALVWALVITDNTQPIWFYCGNTQPTSQCAAGMVGAINPASFADYSRFLAASKNAVNPLDYNQVALTGLGAFATRTPAPVLSVSTPTSISKTSTLSVVPGTPLQSTQITSWKVSLPTSNAGVPSSILPTNVSGTAESHSGDTDNGPSHIKAFAIGGSVGSIVALVLLSLLVMCLYRHFYRPSPDHSEKRSTFVPAKMLLRPSVSLRRWRKLTARMHSSAAAPQSLSPSSPSFPEQESSTVVSISPFMAMRYPTSFGGVRDPGTLPTREQQPMEPNGEKDVIEVSHIASVTSSSAMVGSSSSPPSLPPILPEIPLSESLLTSGPFPACPSRAAATAHNTTYHRSRYSWLMPVLNSATPGTATPLPPYTSASQSSPNTAGNRQGQGQPQVGTCPLTTRTRTIRALPQLPCCPSKSQSTSPTTTTVQTAPSSQWSPAPPFSPPPTSRTANPTTTISPTRNATTRPPLPSPPVPARYGPSSHPPPFSSSPTAMDDKVHDRPLPRQRQQRPPPPLPLPPCHLPPQPPPAFEGRTSPGQELGQNQDQGRRRCRRSLSPGGFSFLHVPGGMETPPPRYTGAYTYTAGGLPMQLPEESVAIVPASQPGGALSTLVAEMDSEPVGETSVGSGVDIHDERIREWRGQ